MREITMLWESVAVIVLAAGKGRRMRSDIPKVLHHVNGKSMIRHVVGTAVSLRCQNIVVVVGHEWEMVQEEIDAGYEGRVTYAMQERLLGTGDAVRCAIPYLLHHIHHVLVLCGDVPLIRRGTLESFFMYHMGSGNDISVFAVNLERPRGYGRIIVDAEDRFIAIREEGDATEEERGIKTINAGIYSIRKDFLIHAIERIGVDNRQSEYYLTDIVAISCETGASAGYFMGDNPKEVMGINTQDELKTAEQILRSGAF
ncbi:MAG: NTP transferase domain-containing protein [Desulfamplus sp.]|nr:NTP transferase domain-containing protein [Desulfamplus sp.]